MSMFSKAVRNVVSKPLATVAAPVLGVTKAFTGMDIPQQLAIGAGLGGAMHMLGAGTTAGGIPGLQGGPPLVNGSVPTAGTSALSLGSAADWLGPGASVFGSIQNSKAVQDANERNLEIAREQMGFSAGQAQREMDFQERMSNTSYQRGVEDMKKAGINPMLAIDQGGASSPGGAAGSSAGATMEPVPSVVANSLTSAASLVKTLADVKNIEATTRNVDESTNNVRVDSLKKTADILKMKADVGSTNAAKKAQVMANVRSQRQLAAESKAPRLFGWLDAIADRLPFVHSASSIAHAIK